MNVTVQICRDLQTDTSRTYFTATLSLHSFSPICPRPSGISRLFLTMESTMLKLQHLQRLIHGCVEKIHFLPTVLGLKFVHIDFVNEGSCFIIFPMSPLP